MSLAGLCNKTVTVRPVTQSTDAMKDTREVIGAATGTLLCFVAKMKRMQVVRNGALTTVLRRRFVFPSDPSLTLGSHALQYEGETYRIISTENQADLDKVWVVETEYIGALDG